MAPLKIRVLGVVLLDIERSECIQIPPSLIFCTKNLFKRAGGEAVQAFLKEAQLIRNYPVYKFSRDDKALDLVQRDH